MISILFINQEEQLMKLLTFQPLYVDHLLCLKQKYTVPNLLEDTETFEMNKRFADYLKFNPIWCIPIYDDADTIYNLVRCSPSFPQCAIIFEKKFEDVKIVSYAKYAQYCRGFYQVFEGINLNELFKSTDIEISDCILNFSSEEQINTCSAHVECIVDHIDEDEVIKTCKISESENIDTLNSDLFDYLTSNQLKELVNTSFALKTPTPQDEACFLAWQILLAHKLIDYTDITEQSIAYSLELFEQHCLERK